MRADGFPIGLRLDGRRCLVVGSGSGAARRTRDWLAMGATVRIVAERPTEPVVDLASDPRVHLERRGLVDGDFDDVWLAVLTDEDPSLAARMGTLAAQHRIFFCAVDQPEHSTFSHMGRARAGALEIAIATSGLAPALSRRMREELQRVLDASDVEVFVQRLAELRRVTPASDRADVLGRAVEGLRLTGKLALPDDD